MHSYPLTSTPLTEQQHQQLMQALIHAEAELRAPGLTSPAQRAVSLEEIDQALAVLREARPRQPLKVRPELQRYLAEQVAA